MKRLRLIALLVGIASIIEVTVWGLYHYEGGRPSWAAVPPLSVYIVPFIICLAIAWKKPFTGGLILSVISSIGLIADFTLVYSSPTSQPVLELLVMTLGVVLPVFLAPLVTGVLFLLVKEEKRAANTKVRRQRIFK